MRFQPRAPICKEPSGGLDLAVELRRIVAVKLGDRRPIKSLNDLDHACVSFAWARNSSTRTRMFSE